MNKSNLYAIFIVPFFLISCKYNESVDFYELHQKGKIVFQLDDNTSFFSKAVFSFTDSHTGREYLSFENNNSIQQEILIWDIDSHKLTERINIMKEGPDGLVMGGHYIKSLDSIYVTTKG